MSKWKDLKKGVLDLHQNMKVKKCLLIIITYYIIEN